tara:strand:+ start:530 stop:1126 length:597 start_codon:yes stop_codon:yes gene_type:complete
MGLISSGTTVFDAGAMALGGSLVFIKKLTASSSSDLTFVNGASSVVLDGTYKEYLFLFKNIHSSNGGVTFRVNFRDGGSNYDAPKTGTLFYSTHGEDGTSASLTYEASYDVAESTTPQILHDSHNDNDECISGYMCLYDPGNTTFVKHYLSRVFSTNDNASDYYISGYNNVTAAIDAVQFTMSAGTIDAGTICLYGIK